MLPTRAYLVRSAQKNAWLLYFAASLPIAVACGSSEATASLPPDLSGLGGDPGNAGGSSVSGVPAGGQNDTTGGAPGTTQRGPTTSAGGTSAGTSGNPGSSESSGGDVGLGGSSSTGGRQNTAGADGNGGRGVGGRRGSGGSSGTGGREGSGGESRSGGAPGTDAGRSDCSNGVKDGEETDVDCGGPACMPCDDGKQCVQDRDCVSNNCAARLSSHVCRAVDN